MTTILIKKKDTAGAPAAGDLTNAAGGAEIAVNTATKRIYTKDSGGTVVETGTNPSILNVDNIQIDVNTISSTDTNGNINLTPNGTGSVVISKLNVTGAITFDGNVTVGNSSSDTLTVNSTITSNLLFTDATYNIGAAGANRVLGFYQKGLYQNSINVSTASITSAFQIANGTYDVNILPYINSGSYNTLTQNNDVFFGDLGADTRGLVLGRHNGSAIRLGGTSGAMTFSVQNSLQATMGASSMYFGTSGSAASTAGLTHAYNNKYALLGGNLAEGGVTNTNPPTSGSTPVAGLSVGWNRSNGDGETTIAWSTYSALPSYLQFATWDGTDFTTRASIQKGGDFWINTTSSVNSSLFSMQGTTNMIGVRQTASGSGNNYNIWSGNTAGSATFYATAGGSVYVASQIRVNQATDVTGAFIQARSNYTIGSFFTGITALPSNGDSGGLTIGALAADNSQINSGAIYYSTGQHYPYSTTATTLSMGGGTYTWNSNTGLTAGALFTPTFRMTLNSRGELGVNVDPYVTGGYGTGSYGNLQVSPNALTMPTGDSNVPAGYSYAQFNSAGGGLVNWLLLRGSYSNSAGSSGIFLQDTFYDNTSYGGRYIRAYQQQLQFGRVANGTIYSSNATLNTPAMIITGSGLVGINQQSPSGTLDVIGSTSLRKSGSGSDAAAAGGFFTENGAKGLVFMPNAGGGNYNGRVVTGDAVMYGAGQYNPIVMCVHDGTSVRLTQTAVELGGNTAVYGALSKSSGSFRIDHPLPQLEATHQLVHSFVEAPQADLYYRGKVALVGGKATINIDAAAGMTEGTFVVLCRETQCFTTNETDWTAVRGSVSGNILSIEAQDPTSTASVSWLVIGERQDKHMMDTEWTDDNGRVIVEPLKP